MNHLHHPLRPCRQRSLRRRDFQLSYSYLSDLHGKQSIMKTLPDNPNLLVNDQSVEGYKHNRVIGTITSYKHHSRGPGIHQCFGFRVPVLRRRRPGSSTQELGFCCGWAQQTLHTETDLMITITKYTGYCNLLSLPTEATDFLMALMWGGNLQPYGKITKSKGSDSCWLRVAEILMSSPHVLWIRMSRNQA